jgi:hypothetical protein
LTNTGPGREDVLEFLTMNNKLIVCPTVLKVVPAFDTWMVNSNPEVAATLAVSWVSSAPMLQAERDSMVIVNRKRWMIFFIFAFLFLP